MYIFYQYNSTQLVLSIVITTIAMHVYIYIFISNVR